MWVFIFPVNPIDHEGQTGGSQWGKLGIRGAPSTELHAVAVDEN
jgi:hypothetical protein